MKRLLVTFFSGACLIVLVCSWTSSSTDQKNADSWSISIGKTDLLCSWNGNQMGETVTVDLKKFKITDTLFAQRFLCGFAGMTSDVMMVTNVLNKTIKKSIPAGTKKPAVIHSPYILLKDILQSENYKKGEIIHVYYSVTNTTNQLNETVLLGKLKLLE